MKNVSWPLPSISIKKLNFFDIAIFYSVSKIRKVLKKRADTEGI